MRIEESAIKGLTEKERVFLDHLEFENLTAGEGIPKAYPARTWLLAYKVFEHEIATLISLRSWERRSLLHELPKEPFKPAWETGEEARQRAKELAPVLAEMENHDR
jgi:hypothetical protein